MKKRYYVLLLIIIILIIILLHLFCPKLKKEEKIVDNYKKLDFMTNVQWERDNGVDTEILTFTDQGEYSYYCACGNPIDDYDLCEGYDYDENTKTITLKCSEKTDKMATTIKIVSYTNDELVLDFNGEVRTFIK